MAQFSHKPVCQAYNFREWWGLMDSDFFDDESEEVDDAVMDCKWDTSDEDWESDTSDEDWVPGGGWYSGFQVTAMIEGFFWVWNFRFWNFFG